ncbi:subclass B1 metallo-beta-lactamase [Wenyingzhuangia sp. IMCC45574]
MTKQLTLLLIAIILISTTSFSQSKKYAYNSEILKVKQITPTIFKHVSFLQTESFGKVGCNGMIYINNKEAIVFDTAIDNASSKELIDWIQKEKNTKIKAVIITHFHDDCLGGIKAFHEKSIKSYVSKKTFELIQKDSTQTVLPKKRFKTQKKFRIGKENVIVKYFGEGHTEDNVVGYIPSEKALFGGCLLKALKSGKGYLGDANTKEWSKTVAKIKTAYPNLQIVVPGHGKEGGMGLLDYTIQMFENN